MQPGMMGMQPGMMGMQPGMMGMQPGMQPMQNMYGGVMYPQQGVAAPVSPQQPMQNMQNLPPTAAVSQAVPTQSPAQNSDSISLFTPSSSPSSGTKFSSSSPARSNSKSAKGRRTSSGPSPMVRNIIALVGLVIVVILAVAVAKKFGGSDAPSVIEVGTDENGNSTVQLNNPLDSTVAKAPTIPDTAAPAAAPVAAPPANEGEKLKPIDSAGFQVPDFAQIYRLMTDLDFEGARKLLNKSFAMNLAPENTKRLNELQLVMNYAEEFYKNASDSVDKMEPFKQLCDGEYGVVEAGNGSAKIRIAGKNIDFSLKSPRAQGYDLYDIIYRDKYKKFAEKGNMQHAKGYGTFQLILPEGDKDTGTKILNEVLEKGNEKDREEVHQIYETFGINGLGAMTNQALSESEPPAAATEEGAADAQNTPDEPKENASDDSSEKTGTADDSEKTSKSGKKSKKAKGDGNGDADGDGVGDSKKTDEAAEKEKAEQEKAEREQERHQEEWRKITTQVRQDLGWRRIPQVKRNLDALQKIAQTDEEKNEMDRLVALTSYTETFITWVGNYMGGFTPGNSVNIDGQDIGIVESTPGRLIIREQGVNKTYTVDDLNPKLVAYLVQNALKAPDDYVLYGTYLAMAPDGDRAKAKTLWETAKTKGFDADSIDLIMQELEVPLVDSGRKPAVQTVRSGKNKPAMEPQEVPTGDAHEKALAKIKEEFAKDYAKTDRYAQSKQAEKFLKLSQSSNRPADEAYVLSEEACRIAMENSYFETAYQAMIVQQSRFQQDTYQDRLSMITKANPTARGQSSASEVVNCAIEMGADAVQRKKKIDANQMLNIAKKNAKGSQVQRVRELERLIGMMK